MAAGTLTIELSVHTVIIICIIVNSFVCVSAFKIYLLVNVCAEKK